MREIEKVKIPEESEGGDFQTNQSYKDQSREHRSYERSTFRKFQGVFQTGEKVSLRNEIFWIFTMNKLKITYLATKSFHWHAEELKVLKTIFDALTWVLHGKISLKKSLTSRTLHCLPHCLRSAGVPRGYYKHAEDWVLNCRCSWWFQEILSWRALWNHGRKLRLHGRRDQKKVRTTWLFEYTQWQA